MALAGMGERGRLPGLPWDWRAELTTVARGLRSVYPYLLALAAALALTLAYQSPRPTVLTVGGGYDAPYVRSFHEREVGPTGERFRYATSASRTLLPGVGGRPSTLSVTAATRPDGAPQPVRVVVNGLPLGEFTPTAGLATYRFALPAANYSYDDLTVDLIGAAQRVRGPDGATEAYGPRVAEVRVDPVAGGGFIKPAARPFVAWVAIAPLLYFLLLRLGVPPLAAAVAGAGVVAAGAAATVVQRLDLALFAPRLAFLLALAYLLLIGTDLLVPRLFARGGVAIDARAWRILQLLFLLALGLKLGGILHPQLVVIDQRWHAKNFEEVLQGRFLALYRPDPRGISGVPEHWGVQAQIPYPPFLYVFGLPFYLWPLGKELSINLWSGLLDLSRVFLVFYLVRRLGGSARAGLIAAFVMGLTAATFLLHSWGNYPTTISLWCAFLFLTLLVANFQRLRRPPVFAGLLALLTLTLLLYTVTAAFIGLTTILILAGLAWRGGPDERRQLPALAGILAGASTIAFLAYYVQYVGPTIAQTLPAFRGEIAQGAAIGGIERDPFPLYAWRYLGRLARYGVLLSLLLAPLGAWALLRGPRGRLAGTVLGAWFAVFALFFLVGARLDMVDKEVWFILPAVAVCAGVACDATLDRARRWGLGGRWRLHHALLAAYLGSLAWGGIALWIFRITVVRHE